MAAEIYVRRVANALLPSLPEGVGDLEKFKQNTDMLVTIRTARKGWYHRRLFALLDFMYSNFDLPTAEYKGQTITQTRESFREAQTILAGHYVMDVRTSDNAITYRAKSIAYSNCSQEEIEPVYDNMVDRVAMWIGYEQADGTTAKEVVEAKVDEWLKYANLPPLVKDPGLKIVK